MATVNVYEVRFQVVKVAPQGSSNAYQYRRELRKALVVAASIHPKDLLTVLNADITMLSGESVEVLGVSQVSGGTEGASTVLD
jgi:hypothetical protein